MTVRHGGLAAAGFKKTAASFKTLARTTLVGAAVAAVGIGIAVPAQADPTPTKPKTVAEAKALVDDLEMQSAAFDQKYVDAQEKYGDASKTLANKQRDLAAQRTKVAELRHGVALIALSQYQSRGIDNTTKLLVTSHPEVLLRDLSVTERVTASQKVTLQNYQTQTANLADLERSAETDVSTMKAATEEMAEARKQAQSKLDEAKKILAQLTQEERDRIEAQRRAEQEAADRAAQQAQQEQQAQSRSTTENSRSNQRTQTPAKPTTPTTPTPPPPASGRAGAAIAFAVSKLGTPYLYGGTGPRYDCSGLTQAAWRAAGVSIGRTTYAQWGGGRAISRADLQPGDLVFYYGLGHVAMYVGNNTIIHSPRTGTVVRYDSINSMPVSGYRRVG